LFPWRVVDGEGRRGGRRVAKRKSFRECFFLTRFSSTLHKREDEVEEEDLMTEKKWERRRANQMSSKQDTIRLS
jgi:hypothetical protein